MSSQGPPTGPTGSPPGYAWNLKTIRDSSDWTAYMKQARIYKNDDIAKSNDPWFVYGQNHKLDYLNGKNKCDKCEAGAFNGPTGPVSS